MMSLAIDKADAVIQDEKLKDLHDNLLHVQYYHENYVSTLEIHRYIFADHQPRSNRISCSR